MSEASATGVDRENPWPGLASFTEEISQFFFGRDEEAKELFRLVRRETLTTLFGQSGLGKSSLLQAGLFPRLRQAHFLPVYLRLDHSPQAPPLPEQVKAALRKLMEAGVIDGTPPAVDSGETLWEYFHGKEVDFWTEENELATPVLVFDQFEELFTLGRLSDIARARGEEFLQQLSDLIENRMPESLRARIDQGKADAEQFTFDNPGCKILLTLREDYLPELEGLRARLRGIMQNRMRVCRMNAGQALEAIVKGGGHLVDDGVAPRIVQFVSAAGSADSPRAEDPSTNLSETDVEPALLSIFCRELNSKRIQKGTAKITVDLLSASQKGILSDFYQRSVEDLPESMRVFVEDRLLTPSGIRDNIALENALLEPGVTRDMLERLVTRRLLRLEDRPGGQRVELTHDVLAQPIRASRDERQQRLASARAAAREAARAARRRTIALLGGAVVVILALIAAGAGWMALRQKHLADENARLAAEREVSAAAIAKLANNALHLAEERGRLADANGALAKEKGKFAERLGRTLSETDARIGHLLLEQGRDNEALPYEARALNDPLNQPAVADSVALLYRVRAPVLSLRHAAGVTVAAFSPDGTRVVTASDDKTARVWDAATGKPIGEPMRHEGKVWSAAFSPDGTRLVTASANNWARVWDATTGKPFGDPMRHWDQVNSAVFSPDGTRVATASDDNTARVWDVATGKPLGEPMQHGDRVNAAAFSHDGMRVVTASEDKTARVWDAATGKPLGPPMHPEDRVTSASFSPDGTRVLTVSFSDTVHVWDAATAKPVGTPMRHRGWVNSASFSPDGTRVVTASWDTTARVWDAATGMPLAQPMLHGNIVGFAAFSADGTRVVTASWDNTARVWDAASGKPLGEPLQHDNMVNLAAFSPDGTRVITASRDETARVWETTPGRPLDEPLRHESAVNSAAFSPDGLRLVTADGDFEKRVGDAQVWDASTRQPLGQPLRHANVVRSATFSPDGMQVLTACEDSTARVWDAAGKPVGEPMRHELQVNFAAYSPDGTRVVTASDDKTARVWDVATGRQLLSVHHAGGVVCAAFSPDGTRIVTASRDKTAQVWSAVTGKPLGEPLHHDGTVWSASFSPDGTRIVTSSMDKTAQLWDAATGKPLGETMRHDENVYSAAFSPDGTRVVTACFDGIARLWDATTGKPLGEPMRHRLAVSRAAFSPDGTRVVTASGWFLNHIGETRLWDVAIPAPAGSAFLAQLDQLAANRRLSTSGFAEPLPDWMAVHDSLKQQAESAAATQPSARWMPWFLADHLHRTISPFSRIMVAQWISNRLEENTAEGVRSAWEMDPNNARCLARLARSMIREIPQVYAAAVPIYVDLYSRRAVELAPKDADVLWRRAAMLAWLGRRSEAEKLARECPQPAKEDLWAWEAKWEASVMLKHGDDADLSLAVAQVLAKGRTKFIRDSLDQNVKEFQSLPARAAATQP